MSANGEYNSKVDWWLGLLIGGLLLGGIAGCGIGIYLLATSGDPAAAWTALGSGLFVVLLVIGLVWPVRYTLTQDSLVIQSGLLRSRYDYDTLKSAAPSRNFLSSPALSLDRIKIEYEGKVGFFMISPSDKEAFMQDLASRVENLEYTSGEVKIRK